MYKTNKGSGFCYSPATSWQERRQFFSLSEQWTKGTLFFSDSSYDYINTFIVIGTACKQKKSKQEKNGLLKHLRKSMVNILKTGMNGVVTSKTIKQAVSFSSIKLS